MIWILYIYLFLFILVFLEIRFVNYLDNLLSCTKEDILSMLTVVILCPLTVIPCTIMILYEIFSRFFNSKKILSILAKILGVKIL